MRPRATEADIDAAIAEHLPWLEKQLANVAAAESRARAPVADRRSGPPRGARADLAARPVGDRRARRQLSAHHAARPGEPLGLVLSERRSQLQLAARARAARRARLRRRPRGVPPRRAQPRRRVLAPCRKAAARLPRLEGVARRARLGDPRVPPAGRGSCRVTARDLPLLAWNAGRASIATAR